MPDQKQDDYEFYEEPGLLDVYRRDSGDGHYVEGVVVGKQVDGQFERDGHTVNRWSATLIYDGQSEWRFNSHTRFSKKASGQWTPRNLRVRGSTSSRTVGDVRTEIMSSVVVEPVVIEPVVVVRQDVAPAENLRLASPSEAPANITESYEGVKPVEARPVLTMSVGDSEPEAARPVRRRRFGG